MSRFGHQLQVSARGDPVSSNGPVPKGAVPKDNIARFAADIRPPPDVVQIIWVLVRSLAASALAASN